MKIVFIGASHFGLKCLDALRRLPGCEVTGAVTAPKTFAISYRPSGVTNVLHADVAAYCDEHRIPCETIKAGMKGDALLSGVVGWAPDCFIVAGWYHMVPKAWRTLAPAYGLHASLLPDYSGGAPLVWAMINGEPRTGITLFQFADGVDNGPIVGQAVTDITVDDTIATLYARIERLGLELIRTYVPQLADGTAVLTRQDESRRRLFPQRGPEDGRINWSLDAAAIHNFVRAQTRPYPGAFTHIIDDVISIWSTRPIGGPVALQPGEIAAEGGLIYAGCGNRTALQVMDISINGRDATPTDLWHRYEGRRPVFEQKVSAV